MVFHAPLPASPAVGQHACSSSAAKPAARSPSHVKHHGNTPHSSSKRLASALEATLASPASSSKSPRVHQSSSRSARLKRRTSSMHSDMSRMSIQDDDESDGLAATTYDDDHDYLDAMSDEGVDVHVEVRMDRDVGHQHASMGQYVQAWLVEEVPSLKARDVYYPASFGQVTALAGVQSISIAEISSGSGFATHPCTMQVHVYRALNNVAWNLSLADSDDDQADVTSASVTPLPSIDLVGVWDNLIYSDSIKLDLLNYIEATMNLSSFDVDLNTISWNRMCLLHGPPGTGKTTLCRALAQKLSIRLQHVYTSAKLIEINSHSLFSKWFSESGKLVQQLFTDITEFVESPRCFVVVLIDEVESLTAARQMGGTEPTDSLRVVNALLTQLDKLKRRPNVLVMTTSNLASGIDPAFLDRADIKRYVPLPPPEAIYWILVSTLDELARKGLVSTRAADSDTEPAGLASWSTVVQWRAQGAAGTSMEDQASVKLAKVAEQCHAHDLSGRYIRRIPVLALAHHVKPRASLAKWVDAYGRVVEAEFAQAARIRSGEVEARVARSNREGSVKEVKGAPS